MLIKKIGRISLKIIISFLLVVIIIVAGMFVTNKILNRLDDKKITDYGQKISVDDKKINVSIHGNGQETIVLLPGFGTAAPALDFTPLVNELKAYYKVVVVEPLGYGLSDLPTSERSTKNIVSEIHETLQKLDITSYTLMGHSIAGIYGLDYSRTYPDEVTAFVGIDTSFPTQSVDPFPASSYKLLRDLGVFRLLLKPDSLMAPDVDSKTKEQIRLISLKNTMNAAILSEGEQMEANFNAAKNINFPKELPVLFFLAEASIKDTEGWETKHEEQIKGLNYGKVEIFEGEHYLHYTKSKEMVESYRDFIKNVPSTK